MKVTIGQKSFKKYCPNRKFVFSLIFLGIFLLSTNFAYSQRDTETSTFVSPFNEDELKVRFDNFIDKLEPLNLTKKYPEITRKILSCKPEQQEIALKMLAESEEIDAIPWILLLLDSDESSTRTWAGNALEDIVIGIVSYRRDMKFPGIYVFKPLGKQDVDLKPMAWIVLRMIRSGNHNQIAYGISMARYLNLFEFEGVISSQQYSQSPAVTNAMKWALEGFKLQKKYDKNELTENK